MPWRGGWFAGGFMPWQRFVMPLSRPPPAVTLLRNISYYGKRLCVLSSLHRQKAAPAKAPSRVIWQSRPSVRTVARSRSLTTDPQGTLSDGWNARPAPTPLFAAVDVVQLPSRLEALRAHGIELVIIDTPTAFTQTTHAALALADLVIVPVRPSPHDLRAVGTVIEVVAPLYTEMQAINGRLDRMEAEIRAGREETTALRGDMQNEFKAVRAEIAILSERLTRMETLLEQRDGVKP